MRGVHVNASASVEWQSRDRRETRAAGLSNLVPLVTRVVICVSRMVCSTDQEKEGLLVVYLFVACSFLQFELYTILVCYHPKLTLCTIHRTALNIWLILAAKTSLFK